MKIQKKIGWDPVGSRDRESSHKISEQARHERGGLTLRARTTVLA